MSSTCSSSSSALSFQIVLLFVTVFALVPSAWCSSDDLALSVMDSTCGGGFYNLSTIQNLTLKGTRLENYYYVDVCGAVSFKPCQNFKSPLPSMLCLINNEGPPVIISLAYYNASAAIWSKLSGNLLLRMNNGDLCPARGPGARYSIAIQFNCDANATSPRITSIVVHPDGCLHALWLATNLVCGSHTTSGFHQLRQQLAKNILGQ